MKKEDRLARDMRRIEEAERLTRERMAEAQARVDRKFDHMRQRLVKKYGEPNDNQQRIIEAALDLLRQDGLANITLRKLASRVDMKAPALYWYFQSKEELVDYMAEAILQQEFIDLRERQADEPWQDWLDVQMSRLRKAMLRYPDGARVVAGAHLYPAVTLGKLFEYTLESLVSAGFQTQTARHILMTATTYTFGFVIEEQSMPNSEEIAMLNKELSDGGYPRIVEAMQEAHKLHRDMGHDYRAGLQMIIKGATA
jgi:TetR/AcrR family transcriptional regulator, tetracycline repressor protein